MTTSSPPSSQGSSSSDTPTPVHSAAARGVVDCAEEETPIPPPRKKKTTRKRMALPIKKDSESSLDLLSPDGSASGSSNGGQRSQQHSPLHSQTTSAPANGRSHDRNNDVTSQSPDPFSEEDLFPEDSADCFDSSMEATKRRIKNGDLSALSVVGSGSDAPSSRTSLMAMVDSTSSGLGHRPYSVLVSPHDINSQFNFPEDSCSRLSGLITLPRGTAQTWSPRSQLMNSRQSQRSAQFPYSSKCWNYSTYCTSACKCNDLFHIWTSPV